MRRGTKRKGKRRRDGNNENGVNGSERRRERAEKNQVFFKSE